MARWVTTKQFVTADQDRLTRIIVYPEGENKQHIKGESRGYHQERMLLIPREQGYEVKE
ncbi:hypothetical protein [Bacillus solitudinis]|uniref:hypothetical protein n=1 Tax=Bacillus solitudinis TaxID=2014074 RepID=UPI0012FDEABC|nr:hypothetical protein [Bacillus solitudinis]